MWVRFNNLLEAESLLTRFPLLVATWENQYGDTPLHIAVKEQHLDMVRLLLERGSPTVKTNMDGHTPMDIAKTGNREIVELLSAAE